MRDSIAGTFIKERDWVCTGATENILSKSYFKSVGKDFPVLLNPETHEEYALARIETKTGLGYKNFSFLTGSIVTLLEDIKRRDLTINAIARSENGIIIDPYSGVTDFEEKILKHTTRSFTEDPVRILRIARLHAKYPEFTLNEKTKQLMSGMVLSGEIDYLSPDRVWKEFVKAIAEKKPIRFFQTSRSCNALPVILPNVNFTNNIISNFIKTVSQINSEQVRFAVLMASNNIQTLLHYNNHYNIPKKFSSLTKILCQYIGFYCNVDSKNPNLDTILRLIVSTDAARRPDRFSYFLISVIFCTKNRMHSRKIKIIKFIMSCIKSLRLSLKGNKSAEAHRYILQARSLKRILKNYIDSYEHIKSSEVYT